MSMGLTQRQSELLGFVKERLGADGIGPSYDEICDRLQIRSRGTVAKMVDMLVERGALVRIHHKSRSLALPDPGVGTGFIVNPIPEVRRAIEKYAAEHRIPVRVAAEEALRAYFVEARAG